MNDKEELSLKLGDECDIEAAIETMIFMSKDPISPEQIHEWFVALEIPVLTSRIKHALNSLLSVWEDKGRILGRGLMLRKVAGGYLFCTAVEQAPVVKIMAAKKPIELSKAQIEVLSIVAYRQPLTRVDVDEIRGVDSSFALKRLMQLKLLKILGKSEGLGRPLLYGTTKHFLEFFSLNSLNDLPTLKQFLSLGVGAATDNVDMAKNEVSLVDLFSGRQNNSMFSEEIERASVEALKGLDDALLRIDSAEKSDF